MTIKEGGEAFGRQTSCKVEPFSLRLIEVHITLREWRPVITMAIIYKQPIICELVAAAWILVASHHRIQKAAQGQIHKTFGPRGVENVPMMHAFFSKQSSHRCHRPAKAGEERARWVYLQKERKELSSKI